MLESLAEKQYKHWKIEKQTKTTQIKNFDLLLFF